jgi:hypothetical protein
MVKKIKIIRLLVGLCLLFSLVEIGFCVLISVGDRILFLFAEKL